MSIYIVYKTLQKNSQAQPAHFSFQTFPKMHKKAEANLHICPLSLHRKAVPFPP